MQLQNLQIGITYHLERKQSGLMCDHKHLYLTIYRIGERYAIIIVH